MITLEKLIEIISSVLEIEDDIDIDSSSDNIGEWDSMSQVLITSEISELTNSKSDDIEELFEETSVRGIFNLLNDNNLIKV
tara:strand:+ start:26141 stop:26383 length:243 start_codon:yes stop_codon:yes gene_type:complete